MCIIIQYSIRVPFIRRCGGVGRFCHSLYSGAICGSYNRLGNKNLNNQETNDEKQLNKVPTSIKKHVDTHKKKNPQPTFSSTYTHFLKRDN